MIVNKFTRDTIITFSLSALSMLVGVGTTVILARALGPEGNGIYVLAVLLPSLVITFGNLGIGPATVYYAAQGTFQLQKIFGNNIFFSIGISILGIFIGIILVLFCKESVFNAVSPQYLLMALLLIPGEVFFGNIRYVLLGAQHIKKFNSVQLVQSILVLGFILIALLGFKTGVTGAILATVFAWFVADVFVFYIVRTVTGKVSLTPDFSYIKQAITYGIQAHLANILGFLNYRVDMLMINAFLGPAAVGLYAIGVGLAERLWMISFAASTVLFPRVAAETEERRRKSFTPLVARTVFWITAASALMLALLSRRIVLLLYSETFLPAVTALQALLVGIVALSAGRVLANDIAGRGFPRLNIYTGLIAVVTNIALNVLLIPRYGIAGAGWASTASYAISFLGTIFFYCRLSGNRWAVVVFPQQGDWQIYWNIGKALYRWARGK